MTVILELNDTELTLYRGTERVYHAPAIAIVQEGNIRFGEPALRVARIHPQETNQQYLTSMNADPLRGRTRTAANQADLVYLHFKQIKERFDEDVVLAVPGTLTGEQLGILLGISQEAGFEVSGFVDAAVAAVSTTRAPGEVAYLDIQLQHFNITELAIGDQVRRTRAFELRDCGFTSLIDGWVNLLADRFVSETRFDPLHTADTEQQVYNQVYDWVVGAHYRAEVSIEIEHADQRRRVEVARSQLESKAQQRYQRLLEAIPSGMPVLLSARTSRIPGLVDSLKNAGFSVDMLVADAVAQGCVNHMEQVRTIETELHLVTHLPHQHEVTTADTPAPTFPTHLLQGSVARTIDSETTGIRLRRDASGVWLGPVRGTDTRLNNEPLTGEVQVNPGDTITAGAESYLAIRVDG